MSFSIIDHYESFVSNNFIKKDLEQIKLLKEVSRTWINSNKKSLIFKKNKKKGVYVHGSVGTGKTFLLNLICQFTKVGKKIHFNHLMSEVHSKINTKDNKEKKLERYIKKISLNVKILFIDEMHIFNIVDALIIKKIFTLFEKNKIFIIVSSNFHPKDLYKEGLQHNDFIPFINYIMEHYNLIKIGNNIDYRRLTLNQSKTYFTPINNDTNEEFNKLFERLVDTSSLMSKTIKTKSRSFVIDTCSSNVALCSFEKLCNNNLGHEDYKNIAEIFSLIFIKNVPQLSIDKADQCRRFISLIDMLYNQNCSVVLLAETPIASLCRIKAMSKEFDRTASRLYEMTIIKPSQ
ncbi:MAG: Cell division protein ZapE [Alphaproteobacteria bacterium MarineAlpha5_Bin5]|nr:MAG: Cell division protein ZapE [Alphaproteobacteria bacterium MarineAlpha5_Bin5]PPR52502.1 MAG: Cell division protein ZapE [Alphaproteobacteria bacterium MarineAlpha5_Bin4]|tara:strand:- start:705 stop:1745 length:1041 start_codon:yes stop_codon:yes gene_type:complete